MPACQAKSCSNRSGLVHNHRFGIYFYQFPSREKSPVRYDKWCRFVGKSKENVKEQRICSYHFKKTDFDESQMLRMKMLSELGERPKGAPLKNTAVPSILTKDMPGKCFVYTCTNTKELFSFPHRFYCPERFQTWVDFCNQNYAPGSKSKMCIEHFTEKYHKLTDRGLKVLTENAVPTITVKEITSKKAEYELKPTLRGRPRKSVPTPDLPAMPRKRGRPSKETPNEEYQIGTISAFDVKPEIEDIKIEDDNCEVKAEDLKPKPSKLSGAYIATIMKEMRMKKQLEKELKKDTECRKKKIENNTGKEVTLSKPSRLRSAPQSSTEKMAQSEEPDTFKTKKSTVPLSDVTTTEGMPLLEKQIENLLSVKPLNVLQKRKCEYFNEITKKPKNELTEFDIQNIINEINFSQIEEIKQTDEKSKMEGERKKKRHRGESDSDESWRGDESDDSGSDSDSNKTGSHDSSDDNKSDKSAKGFSVVKSGNQSNSSCQDTKNELAYSHSIAPDVSNMLLTQGLATHMVPTVGNIITISENILQMPGNMLSIPINEMAASTNTAPTPLNPVSVGKTIVPTNLIPIPPSLLPTLGLRVPGSKSNPSTTLPPPKISLPYLGVNLKTGDLILNPNYQKSDNTVINSNQGNAHGSVLSSLLTNKLSGIGLQLQETKIQTKINEDLRQSSDSCNDETKELQQTSDPNQSEIIPESKDNLTDITNQTCDDTNEMKALPYSNEKCGEQNLSMKDVYEMISKAQNVEKSETGIQCAMGIEKFCNIYIVDEHYYIGRQKVIWKEKEINKIEEDDVEEFEVTKYLLQELTEEEIKEHQEKESQENETEDKNLNEMEKIYKTATDDVKHNAEEKIESKESDKFKSLNEAHANKENQYNEISQKENQNNKISQKENTNDKETPKSNKVKTEVNPNKEVIEIESDKESNNGKECDDEQQSEEQKEENKARKVTNKATHKKVNKERKNVKTNKKGSSKPLLINLKNQLRGKLKNRSKRKLEEVIRNINTRNRNRRIMQRRK